MKQITSIIVFISIAFLIYGLYNCNCNKNKSYEKFESNNNPTFLNIINKNMNNIQNISNFNKKLLKNITDSNFNFNLNKNKNKNKNKNNIEKFIDTIKITTPDDISKLNQIIQDILSGKDADGNYDINNINIQLTNIKTQLDNFLNQQQTEHQTIINSINSSIDTLGKTNQILSNQKTNIEILQGNQTLFNDIAIITPQAEVVSPQTQTQPEVVSPQTQTQPEVVAPQPQTQPEVVAPQTQTQPQTQLVLSQPEVVPPQPEVVPPQPDIVVSEPFKNVNQPMPYNNKLILTNLLSLNENKKQNIEQHKIITKQNKNLFNNLPKPVKMNDFQRCQQNWQLEWIENLRQIKI